MLRKLKLTYFRQHEDAEFEFGDGLIVIRGANEAGKTTLILGAAYALGGSSVLPLSLSDTVTWGRDEKDLKVELEIEIEGRRYVFSRSKAGAECNYAEGKVVGQKEVTAFAAELIGADAKTMAKLMLAKQNSIRGALEEGPAAIASQIETLANFDLFDRVIEKIQTKLVTGPTKILEDRVSTLMVRVSEINPVPPVTTQLDSDIDAHGKLIAGWEGELDNAMLPRFHETQARLLSAETHNAGRDRIARNVENARFKVDTLQMELEQASEVAARPLRDDRLVLLGQRLSDALDHARRQQHYEAVTRFEKTYPEVFWEGDLKSLEAEIDRQTGLERAALNGMHKADSARQVKQSQVVTTSACGLCGQDVSKFPEVARKNSDLEAQIAELTDEARTWDKQRRQALEDIEVLKSIWNNSGAARSFQVIPGWAEKDNDFVPPKIRWVAEVIKGIPADSEALRIEIANLKLENLNIETARDKLPQLQQRLVEEEASLKQALDDLEKTPKADAVHLANVRDELIVQMDRVRNALKGRRETLNQLLAERGTLLRTYEAAVATKQQAEKDLAQAREDLDKLVFNNELLKRVRSARPLIADKLWNQVLSSVSVMFSQTRQQQSVVTKEKDGFKINGKPCEGFSGSALDLLGLAIRMSLVKTFLPHVSMLVLDEPTSACDDDRTSSLLGFIAAAGFDQTILVTHEPVSESFADHLIEL